MRKLVVAAGILIPLVNLLSSKSQVVIAQTLKILITLSLTEENEKKIFEAGAILPIVDLLQYENESIKEQSALLLSNLSCNGTTRIICF